MWMSIRILLKKGKLTVPGSSPPRSVVKECSRSKVQFILIAGESLLRYKVRWILGFLVFISIIATVYEQLTN